MEMQDTSLLHTSVLFWNNLKIHEYWLLFQNKLIITTSRTSLTFCKEIVFRWNTILRKGKHSRKKKAKWEIDVIVRIRKLTLNCQGVMKYNCTKQKIRKMIWYQIQVRKDKFIQAQQQSNGNLLTVNVF